MQIFHCEQSHSPLRCLLLISCMNRATNGSSALFTWKKKKNSLTQEVQSAGQKVGDGYISLTLLHSLPLVKSKHNHSQTNAMLQDPSLSMCFQQMELRRKNMKCITCFCSNGWYPVVSKGFMSALKREHVATQSSSHWVVKEESGGHFKDINLFPVLKCRGEVVALNFPEGR